MFNVTLAATVLLTILCAVFTLRFVKACRAIEEHSKQKQCDFRLEQPGFRPWRVVQEELNKRRFLSGLLSLGCYGTGMLTAIYVMSYEQVGYQIAVASLLMLALSACFLAMAVTGSRQEDLALERLAVAQGRARAERY